MRSKKSILILSALSLTLVGGLQTVEAKDKDNKSGAYTDGSEANKPGKRALRDSKEHGYGVYSSTQHSSSVLQSTGSSGRPSDRDASGTRAGGAPGSDPSQSGGGTR